MALNLLGAEKKTSDRRQPSMPALSLPPDDDYEIEEAAARVAERRIIRNGQEAWHLTQKTASFENWRAIGQALTIGRNIAVRASGATTGKHYAKAFYSWADRHGFDGMHKSDRWAAVDLTENIEAIETWRTTLSEKDRRRLAHPLSNLRAWRRETGQTKTRCANDALKAAEIAWHRFVACVEALPPDQAAPLWQAAQAQAAAFLGALS
jgi:hypothetical protein